MLQLTQVFMEKGKKGACLEKEGKDFVPVVARVATPNQATCERRWGLVISDAFLMR